VSSPDLGKPDPIRSAPDHASLDDQSNGATQPDTLAEPIKNPRRRALKIRVGVGLVIASWLPIAQLTIWITSASGDQASRLRAAIWGVQVVVGLIGVAIAGAETIQIAKSVGWRRAPRVVWRLFRSPNSPIAPNSP
jgi:hypothetical protein